MIKISVRSSLMLERLFSEAPMGMQKIGKNATRVVAEAVKEEAKTVCPVRTGYLRSKMFYRTKGVMAWTVGNEASYAVYVEFGTRFMLAQPYLRPAAIYGESVLAREAEKELKLWLREIGLEASSLIGE